MMHKKKMGGVCAGSGAGADGLQCRELSALWQRQRRQYSPEDRPPGSGIGRAAVCPPAAGDTIAVFDTSAGVFKAVLFPDKAPQAYDNFAGLVQAGYYNGLTFSRVESGFVVEAGQGADGRGSTIWNGSRYPG